MFAIGHVRSPAHLAEMHAGAQRMSRHEPNRLGQYGGIGQQAMLVVIVQWIGHDDQIIV